MLAFPVLVPPPELDVALLLMPQLHARISISSLCVASVDSPLISLILINISNAASADWTVNDRIAKLATRTRRV